MKEGHPPGCAGRLALSVAIFAAWALAFSQSKTSVGSIRGMVVDEHGQPLPHAEVSPDDGTAIGGIMHWYPADKRGRFHIDGLRPGEWQLNGKKTVDGYMDQESLSNFLGKTSLHLHLRPGESVDEVVLHLGPKAATVHIDLMDAKTDQRISDLRTCMVAVQHRDVYKSESQSAPADLLVPPTDVRLTISSPGYSRWTFTQARHDYAHFEPGEKQVFSIRLNPMAASDRAVDDRDCP